MSKVIISADSTCDLSPELVERYGIHILPLHVRLGDNSYRDGVDINDCVALTRALNPVLDEADPIATSYTLEVSSPGIERELTRPEHFEWCEGDAVVVTLFAPKDGVREFAGILQPCDNGQIVITDENGQPLVFDKKEVSSVRLIEEWDDDTDETV